MSIKRSKIKWIDNNTNTAIKHDTVGFYRPGTVEESKIKHGINLRDTPL